MKKILFFACAAMIALASCNGNKSNDAAQANDSTATDSSVVATAEDSLIQNCEAQFESNDPEQVKAALAVLETKYGELVQEGKLDEAKTYATKIQQIISEKADVINTVANGDATIASLVDGIKNLPTSAETTAEEAAKAVKEDAKTIATSAIATALTSGTNVVDAAKSAAEETVNQKVEDAKSAVKAKAAETVAPVTEKAAEVQKKVDTKKTEVKDAVDKAKSTVDAAKGLLGK